VISDLVCFSFIISLSVARLQSPFHHGSHRSRNPYNFQGWISRETIFLTVLFHYQAVKPKDVIESLEKTGFVKIRSKASQIDW